MFIPTGFFILFVHLMDSSKNFVQLMKANGIIGGVRGTPLATVTTYTRYSAGLNNQDWTLKQFFCIYDKYILYISI